MSHYIVLRPLILTQSEATRSKRTQLLCPLLFFKIYVRNLYRGYISLKLFDEDK